MIVNASVPTTDSIGSILDQEDVEPWDWFEQVRALGDVVWDDKAQAWLVTSYDAVLQMSQQDIDVWGRPEQETGSGEWSRYQDHVPEGYTAERWTELVDKLKAFRDDGQGRTMELVKLEGDEHDHQHRWWVSALSPRVLDRWREDKIRPLVHEQLDELAGRDRVELCRDFVDPLVPRIIAGLMGEPTDHEWVQRHAKWSDDHTNARLTQFQADVDPAVIEAAVAAAEGLHETLRPIVEAKRDRDDDDSSA